MTDTLDSTVLTRPRSRARIRTAAVGGRRRGHRRLGQVAIHVILLGMTTVVLLPFLWMVLGSFKNYNDLINRPSQLPLPWTTANYSEIFSQAGFGAAFGNSVAMSIGRVVFPCATSLVLGYIFAKYKFWGREVLFIILLSTMLIPFAAILVPLYLTMSDFNLLNSIPGLVLIALCSTFGTFLLRQWIMGIPDAFIEAARIDGASELWVLLRVILPLSRTPLAALAIFAFLGAWDDYLFPSIVLTDPMVKTLPLALAGLKSLFWERYEIYCAGAMVTVIPVMILYSFMQKHFVRGLTMGGTKE